MNLTCRSLVGENFNLAMFLQSIEVSPRNEDGSWKGCCELLDEVHKKLFSDIAERLKDGELNGECDEPEYSCDLDELDALLSNN